MENSENLIADLDEDLKLLERELDEISKCGIMADVTNEPLTIIGKGHNFAKVNLDSQSDRIYVHGNIDYSSNIEIVSEIGLRTDGIILPNDEISQSTIATLTMSNQAKNSIFVDSEIDEDLDPLKATVTVERDESFGIINNSEISVGSDYARIADNSCGILVESIGSIDNKIEDDNSVTLLCANICDELPTSSLVDSIIVEGYNSGIRNTRLATSDPLSTVGLLIDESGIQVMGVGYNSFQEGLEITASLVNPDKGEVGMITVDPLFNDGLSGAETGIQLMDIDHNSHQKDNQIIDVVNEALDEFEKSFSFDRKKITVESFTKTYSSSSDDLSIRHSNNVTIVNFINVEGDVYENNINLISK